MCVVTTIRYATRVAAEGMTFSFPARYASTKAADSFMAELQASGLTPTEISNVCKKHPDMLSKHWTPAARKQKIELLKKIEEQERLKSDGPQNKSDVSSSSP